MPISQVRFTGMSPANQSITRKIASPANANQVAFTGTNYGKLVKDFSHKMDFPAIWQSIKNLFSRLGKFFESMKPHLAKADQTLGQWGGKVIDKLKPIH